MKNIKKNTKTYFFFIIIIGSSFTKIFGSEYFSPSLIIGVNTNKIYGTGKYSKSEFTDYTYPLGILLGLSNENKIFKSLYLSNRIYFENRKSKMFFHPGAGVRWPYLKYSSNYISLSSMLKIKILNLGDILIGFDLARLINESMNVYDHDGGFEEKFKPQNFPKYDISVCFGINKNIFIKNQKFNIELKYLYGLTEYKFCSKIGCLPNPTKNYGFQLEFGYKLNFFEKFKN